MNVRRILLLRTDRIGDVILTLPMIDLIRSRWPQAEIIFLAREYTKDLVERQPGISRVLVADSNGVVRSDLFEEIRSLGADVAVHVYPRPHLAWLVFRAGIPIRIGTAFRWYSFLFNRRVRDHRSSGELHEAIYNARLLSPLGIAQPAVVRPKLDLSGMHEAVARRVADELGIRSGDGFVILHPGSGGSSRDWPAGRFGELARLLSSRWPVVVTGSACEAALVERVVAESEGKARGCVGKFSLMEFAAFIHMANVFVSNSTGPIHMAAAVGTPVVGFYPPLAAARVGRWGPLGERVVTFTPDSALCPQCRGGPCQGSVCMDQVEAGDVAEKIEELVK